MTELPLRELGAAAGLGLAVFLGSTTRMSRLKKPHAPLRSLALRDIATHIPIAISIGMKTTLDISDPLLRDARKIATREGTTLRALVEQGLRHVVAAKKRRVSFRLRKVTFRGKGLRPELQNTGWEQIRNRVYEGRGE
jgi:hypothetical protein